MPLNYLNKSVFGSKYENKFYSNCTIVKIDNKQFFKYKIHIELLVY